jgi:NitT/TauT family transport system substrate-binding protein
VSAATVVALAAAGCSAAGSTSGSGAGAAGLTVPAPAGPLESSSITVEAVPTADEAGLYVASDLGYFRQAGLTVHIVPTGGGELALSDLTHGKTDLVVGNYVSFVLAQIQHQADIRIIANGSQMRPGNQALFVMPGSKVKTIGDLVSQHATIGVNTLNNIGSLLIGSLLADNGYKLSAVKLLAPAGTGNPFQALLPLLKRGKIQAAWLPEPFATIAQQTLGAVKVADFDSGSVQNLPIAAWIGDTGWVKEHPTTIAAFLHAFQRGQEKADTDRAQVESSLIAHTLAPAGAQPASAQQIASLLTLDSYPLAMDVPELQRVSDVMFQFGLEAGLAKPYPMIQMIQPEPGMVGG